MLNDILIENFKTYEFQSINDITIEALQDFFDRYTNELGRNGEYRGQQSVQKCVSYVCEFVYRYSKHHIGLTRINPEDLYVKREDILYKTNTRTLYRPVFTVKYRGVNNNERVKPDFPEEAFTILINLARRHTPDIAFGIYLGGCAGLRIGEICNVTQKDILITNGTTYAQNKTIFRNVKINLKHQRILRSDNKVIGKIKVHRTQVVYNKFLNIFEEIYSSHMAYLKSIDFEEEYVPLFVNKKGYAMTTNDFRCRWNYLIKDYFIPTLMNHSNAYLMLFGESLLYHKFGVHMLRHWYTTQLVLNKEGVAQIQHLRGDKNPTSALVYLKNKGDLSNMIGAYAEEALDQYMREGEKLYEQEKGR